MQNATYRGVEYTVNNEASAPVDAQLTYRGVEYNPSVPEVAPATTAPTADAQLTYRGAEYVLIREKIKKSAALEAARKAFTRNLSASAIV